MVSGAAERDDPDSSDTYEGRHETEKERLDRNMVELVGELRVALPGVQVLFAFLLSVPFNQRFGQVSPFQKDVYFGTLIATAIATTLLLAPSTLHRIEFRQDDKKHIVDMANRYAIAGFAFLLLAVTGAVTLVTDFLFGGIVTAITTTGVAGMLVSVWYVMPILRRARHGSK
ncbi:MAG: hypothetical protein QOJ07_731 [Thermoleophilaceae bacterium]|jgi:hypothetical protein|nr:hypothetical protein [Thermoleophilaceae bacterium]